MGLAAFGDVVGEGVEVAAKEVGLEGDMVIGGFDGVW